ncbi:MAG: leucyl aminopeptidase [Pseudomonadales bacterium]|nr:leucyl aminopeptidase [Pseudomonadales bacterium]MBO7007015.1 leucyl aminopeptidase [Pseudomonadales bacterium]
MKLKFLFLLTILTTLCAASHAEQVISFKDFRIPDSGRVVVPVIEGTELTGVAAEVDVKTSGALAAAVAEAEFTGKVDKTLTLFGIAPYDRVDLIGLGDKAIDRTVAENFGGTVGGLLGKVKGGNVQVLWNPDGATSDANAARVAFGFRLGSYRFDRYQEDKADPAERPEIVILSNDESASVFASDLDHLARGVYFARDMPSEPGNVIFPESFIDRAEVLLDEVDVKIKVLDEKDLQRLNMEAHYGVGKGSVRPPRLLIIEYMGGGEEAPVVLVGKGITFDTGGISIKQNKGMWAMKGDLGGAAVVIGTLYAAAAREAKMNIVALAALAENMPSRNANRPGDIQRTMSGKTIEILSTDAEGRLVLSDAVHYAQVNYEPSVLIDVATLTGSVGRALGDDYAGVFGRHQHLVDQLIQASRTANEGLWQLPLDDHHFKQLKSDFADIKNSDTGSPGASTGAAFIGSFVEEDQVWAHLDIASVDKLDKGRPTMPKGFSGWGVRTLDEYLRQVQ